MLKKLNQLWREDDGVLSFEWTLLVTLLTFGIVGGLAASRDAIIDELGDAAQAMLALDQSMTIDFPLSVIVHNNSDISSASDSAFTDAAAFTDCARDTFNEGQVPRQLDDNPS
jgi:Flp pilus assembly pilin Flp